ncbi:protein phosphatase 1 regulatory subunit 21 isoform 5-T5 [Amazona ochrocephala]
MCFQSLFFPSNCSFLALLCNPDGSRSQKRLFQLVTAFGGSVFSCISQCSAVEIVHLLYLACFCVCSCSRKMLRAQNQVLKKGVVDEQANSASLKNFLVIQEQLKMKDQSLRKLQQEMDSLTFRNQQLAKRVELLQDELALSEARGKKNKKSAESSSQLSQEQKSVFNEDLQKKIEENERLHILFFEADEQHKRLEAELRTRLEVLETDAAQHQTVVDSLTRKYTDTIEKLQNDKTKLEIKSQTLEREAKDCRLRTEECQQQLKNLQAALGSRLEESLCIINEKVPFNDTRSSRYNALNVPLHNRRYQLKLRDLAGQALAFVQELVTALLNFHTYTEQKIQIFPIDSATDTVSPLNQKFSQYLHENASYVRPLEEGMHHLFESITEDTVTVLETAVKLKGFSEHLASYLGFLRKILPYQLKSLEEECESSLCTAALRARNMELHSDMKRLIAVFEKLHTYVSLLVLPSTKPEGLLRTNYNLVFTNIAASLHGFHDILKDISKHYSQKATLEQDVPTATQKLITTNDCILSSVAALTNGAGKIASFFSNNLDHFTASLSYGPKGGTEFISPLSAECMLQYKKKAVAYMKSLKKPCASSVPYEEALANRRVLLSSTESREGLAQQVQQSLEKIARLEQEKEHWMLEAQLAKIKLEKENQKLKNSLSGHLTETLQEHSVLPNVAEQKKETTEKSLKEPIRSTSLIGMLTITTDNEKTPDVESREDLIKNHYMTRIAELTSHLQLADSKSVHFHAECRALAKRLSLAEKSKESLTEELKLASQNISRLQDELMTTKRSYEDQLSMMSDHLCSMNETLTKQREEIDTLKMTSKVGLFSIRTSRQEQVALGLSIEPQRSGAFESNPHSKHKNNVSTLNFINNLHVVNIKCLNSECTKLGRVF